MFLRRLLVELLLSFLTGEATSLMQQVNTFNFLSWRSVLPISANLIMRSFIVMDEPITLSPLHCRALHTLHKGILA